MNTYVDDLRPGTILQGRYEVMERVGGGGMGTVYKAQDARIANRTIAIKEMKQASLSGADLERARKRFAREAALLSLVQNEHLPHIYDFFEDQGRSYLVMDFIEGITLQALLRQTSRPLPTLQALDFAIQLCDVLTHLHHRFEPIIFRDLKPLNIMVQPGGDVFLIDFGIARNFKQGQKEDTEVFRSPGYTAPEVGFTQTDARSDIFSLGVTLFHCLTRQVPDYFDHNQGFPPVRQFNADVPDELNALIARMVQYRPADRPASAAQVRQQLERIYQQLAAAQMRFGQAGQPAYNPPSFYSDETESGQAPFWRNLARPRVVAPLAKLPALLLAGLLLLLTPLVAVARQASKLVMSKSMRQAVYDQYLYARVRLNATGLWTDRFLLLLFSLLAGSIALSVAIYTQFGSSFYRVEFGLMIVLLIAAVISGGLLHNAVARHLMLCVASLVAVAFLALLASPNFQAGAGTTGNRAGASQPLTFNLLLTYGLVTVMFIALAGGITSMRARRTAAQPSARATSLASSEFVRLGHIAVAGIAGLCFLLQFAFGSQEQTPFVPSAPHPFAFAFSTAPLVTSNVIPLSILGFIALYELKRFPQPFIARDRWMVCLLSVAFVLAQYTFGLNELSRIFPNDSTVTLVTLNVFLLGIPLVLALLALPSLPDDLAWVGLVPAFALSLGVAWLQSYLANQESISLFAPTTYGASNTSSVGNLAHLTAFGQLLFACLALAGALLLFKIIFSRRVASSKAVPPRSWGNGTYTVPAPPSSLIPGAVDRFALLVVALGCGLVQWSFWQGVLQHTLAFDYTTQGTTLLYAAIVSLTFGFIAVGAAVVSVVVTTVNALFQLWQSRPGLEKAVLTLDRLAVLSTAIVTLLLLGLFGDRGGWLTRSYNPASISSSGPDFIFSINQVLLIALSLFALVAFILLFRPKSRFGRWERIALLLSGIGVMLLLTDTGDVQRLSFFSADMQQVAGNIATSLNIDRIVAVCLLLAVLLSLFWLMRTSILVDRLVLFLIFGPSAILVLIDAVSTHHLLLILALLAITQGVLIAAKVEKVRQGNI